MEFGNLYRYVDPLFTGRAQKGSAAQSRALNLEVLFRLLHGRRDGARGHDAVIRVGCRAISGCERSAHFDGGSGADGDRRGGGSEREDDDGTNGKPGYRGRGSTDYF